MEATQANPSEPSEATTGNGPRQPLPTQGMQSKNGVVVGMLEAIEAKLCGLESDTKAAEATAQKEYNSLMTKSKVDKASKNSMQLSPISTSSSQVALSRR